MLCPPPPASEEVADADEPIGGDRLPERASWSRKVALLSAAWSRSLDMACNLDAVKVALYAQLLLFNGQDESCKEP